MSVQASEYARVLSQIHRRTAYNKQKGTAYNKHQRTAWSCPHVDIVQEVGTESCVYAAEGVSEGMALLPVLCATEFHQRWPWWRVGQVITFSSRGSSLVEGRLYAVCMICVVYTFCVFIFGSGFVWAVSTVGKYEPFVVVVV